MRIFKHTNVIKFRTLKIVFIILILSFFSSYLIASNFTTKDITKLKQKSSYKLRTVVIDAGHGGKDMGAQKPWGKEKDITLKIALEVGAMIKSKYGDDIRVIYTRMSDTFVDLHERADIANRNKADVFISIHCNSNKSTKPFGTETYVMGLHVTEENLEVAMSENSVISMEDDYKVNYADFDPNSPESYIMFNLYQNKHLEKSAMIADKIEKEFDKSADSRGVKQAGFLVLKEATMPAVLVEVGFLSHHKEGKYLASKKGQEEKAKSIFNAFVSYKNSVEGL